jgi:hypothetical protein
MGTGSWIIAVVFIALIAAAAYALGRGGRFARNQKRDR